MVQAIHEDRGLKRPMLPWGDDWYRRCEYEARGNGLVVGLDFLGVLASG